MMFWLSPKPIDSSSAEEKPHSLWSRVISVSPLSLKKLVPRRFRLLGHAMHGIIGKRPPTQVLPCKVRYKVIYVGDNIDVLGTRD